jgi:hypothetical protein
VALTLTLKSILRQKKKNDGNSNISPRKNIISKKKSFIRNQNPSRYHNSITNLQKSSYKNRPTTTPGAKIPEATVLHNETKHNIVALVTRANKYSSILVPMTARKMHIWEPLNSNNWIRIIRIFMRTRIGIRV